MSNDYRISVRTMDLGSGSFEIVARPAAGNGAERQRGYLAFVPSAAGVDLPDFATGERRANTPSHDHMPTGSAAAKRSPLL